MQMPRAASWAVLRRTRIERLMGWGLAQAIVLCSSGLAWAQVPRIAVIHEPREAEAARRMQAEVAAAGFDAVDLAIPSTDDRSTAKLAVAARAVAALRLRANGDIELLVVEIASGRVLDNTELSAAGSTGDPGLRAVEDLRAKLIELSLVSPPARDSPASAGQANKSVEPPAPVPALPPTAGPVPPPVVARPRERRANDAYAQRSIFWLQGGIGGATSAGGLAATSISHIGLRFEPSARWSASGFARLPLAAQSVSNYRGRAEVNVRLFGAELGWVVMRGRALNLELGLGASVVSATVRGSASTAADRGRSETLWGGCGFAGLGAAWRLTSWMRVRAEVLVGASAPRPIVRFDGQTVASWGRPFSMGTFGVEVTPFSAGREGP
jgi:hypothetical protein